jgi:hypothetical protein
MIAVFFGPRQITGLSLLSSKKAMDITHNDPFGVSTFTGIHLRIAL